MTTITTPRGSKVRSASARRFVVVTERVDAATDTARHAHIEKRSDNVETLRTFVRRQGVGGFGPEFTARVIIDTRTGSVVR